MLTIQLWLDKQLITGDIDTKDHCCGCERSGQSLKDWRQIVPKDKFFYNNNSGGTFSVKCQSCGRNRHKPHVCRSSKDI